MTAPTRSKWSILLIVVILIGAIGLLTWLMPANRSQAAGKEPGAATFISPIGNPQLGLIKRVNNTAPVPGSVLTYTLSYSNLIPGSTAFAVRLYDFLPTGVQYLSSNPPATPDVNGTLLFTSTSVVAGIQNPDVTVQVRVLQGYPQFTNHALVSADGVTPTTAAISTTVSQPWGQLHLDNAGPTTVSAGAPIVYVLTCSNPGVASATNVNVADVLPAGVSFVGAVPAPTVATPPLLQWSLGTLAPGETKLFTVTTTAPLYTTDITNTALADAQGIPLMTALHATHVSLQVATLNVVKTASASVVNVGDTLVYTLRYSNTGTIAASAVVLTDTLPAGVTPVAAKPLWTTATSQLVAWNIGVLGVGASGQIVVTTTVNTPANRTLINTADIVGVGGSVAGHAEVDTMVRPILLYLPLILK